MAQNRQPLNIPDVFADGRVLALDWWREHGFRSCFVMPLLHQETLLGVLTMVGRELFCFGSDDLWLLDQLLTHTTVAIQDASLYQTLRQSEAGYRFITEHQTDLICRFRPDTTLTFVNAAYCRYFGKTRAELIGRSFLTLIPPEAHGAALAHVNSLIAQPRSVTYAHEVLLPNGVIAWQEWIDHAIVDAQGQVQEFLSVGRDITYRKRIEDALRVSETFTRAILASLQAHIAVLDQDGAVLAVNEAWSRFGSEHSAPSPSRIGVGVNYLEVCRRAAASDAYSRQALDGIQAVLDGNRESFELAYPCPTPPRTLWFMMTVTPLQGCGGVVVSHAEMTQQKQTEAELRERLQFEELVARISSRLIHLPTDEIHGAIAWALGMVSTFLGADYAAVLTVVAGQRCLRVTHCWSAADVTPVYAVNDVLAVDDLPWVRDQLWQGRIVSALQCADSPDAAQDYERLCQQLESASVVGIPLIAHHAPPVEVSLVTAHAPHVWPDAQLQRVRVIGDLLASALARQRAEEALRHSEAALRAKQGELQWLATKLIWAQEEERRRLARELHDDLSQRLASLVMEMGQWAQELATLPPTVADRLQRIQEQLATLTTDVHALSHQLHSTILDDLGLVDALHAECTAVMQREALTVSFEAVDVPTVLPREVMLCLYRILQEGLHNVVKHAHTQRVEVGLSRVNDRLELTIKDTGIGFVPEQLRGKGGVGLASMEERVRLVQGTFALTSHPGHGTTIRVQVPIDWRTP